MKKTMYGLFFCVMPLLAQEKSSFQNLVDFVNQDIISFANPQISQFSPADIALDLLVVGAGCILVDREITGTSFHSNFARVAMLLPFIFSNEYFRINYGKRKPTITKNTLYILFYLACKNGIFGK